MDHSSNSGTHSFLLESWLEFAEAIEAHPEIRKLLFDPVTGLPTTPLLFPRIQMLLEERGEVSLLAVNVVRYSKIEEIYGWKVFDDVMREVAGALERITGTVLRDSDIVAELMISGNAFVVVLSPPRNSVKMDPDARQMIVRKVEDSVREELSTKMETALFRKFGCYVGASTIAFVENTRLERLVHEGLDQALSDSGNREAQDADARCEALREIIADGAVRTVVHPLLDIHTMEIIGYEALSRGPEGSEFERPDKLFKIAYDADLVLRLERLCRKKALEAAESMPAGRLLFLNIEPDAVADPELREIMTTSLLAQSHITPDRIVLEITERSAITDFPAFRSTLEYLRALGFHVAVDDAGAGYGSLQCLAEVHPEWLKIDLSLVRGCDSDEVRASLMGSLVSFADKIGVNLVAEGIETVEELKTLREMGVQYGQGFLFSLPVDPFPSDESFEHLKSL
ncbi:MAG: bifunctional diguanylate cyclase/phosphodiesterase [Actinomycetota bacterium]|nr:bifunctional diguanylate cyclase/phosphodiesterase [Actinomycetota bacterium]